MEHETSNAPAKPVLKAQAARTAAGRRPTSRAPALEQRQSAGRSEGGRPLGPPLFVVPALKRGPRRRPITIHMEAITFAGVLGAIVGSFLNVVAYRLPRHESLLTPASHCPQCGTPVKPYDNIPILSWLLLRGHCRSCSAPISAALPARRGAHRRAVRRRRARAQLRGRDRAERRADPDRRAGRADRPRAPHHPQPHHRAGRRARARASASRSTPPASPNG